MPLFAPSDLVEGMRKQWPRMWIEPLPEGRQFNGRAITHAEWARLLEESSKTLPKSA